MDKTTYMLSFSRLAPIQAVWWGNPDTSGVPTIDYRLTSEYEHENYHSHYTEKTFPLRYIPSIFVFKQQYTNSAIVHVGGWDFFTNLINYRQRMPLEKKFAARSKNVLIFHQISGSTCQ